MPTITLNPDMWQAGEAQALDGVLHKQGDQFEVDDDEWAVLSERTSKYHGNRFKMWVEVDAPAPEITRGWIRAGNLDELTVPDLRELAEARGLPRGGNKTDLIARITSDAESAAESV